MKTVDAQNQKIGRVASQVAKMLMGKDSPEYQPNKVVNEKVRITNASGADIDQKKLVDKTYTRYTGYPSGLRIRTLGDVIEKKGYEEVFKKAVYGMLPDNKLRSLRMKNLEIVD